MNETQRFGCGERRSNYYEKSNCSMYGSNDDSKSWRNRYGSS